jgi:AcrR family transcriptional regulator
MKVEPHPSRRERKKWEAEEKILQVASSLFQTKGFEETTLEDISEGADVSRATLFNYFRTKEALAICISERVAVEVGNSLELHRRRLGSILDLLLEFFVLLAERAQNYPDVFEKASLKLARFSLPPSGKWGDMLARFLKKGQEKGEVREDLDTHELAEIVAAIGMQCVLTWLDQQPRPSLTELLQRRMDLLWGGVRVSKT